MKNNGPSTAIRMGGKQQNNIRCEQVRLLYQGLPASIYSSLGVAAILVFTLWDISSHSTLLLWAGALALLSLVRLWLVSMYKKQQCEGVHTQVWFLRFLYGSTLAGLVWGSAGIFLMPSESIGYQLLVVFILGGIMAGATQSLAAILTAYVMFCIPAGLPAIVWLLLQQTDLTSGMGLLLLLFTLSLVLIARNLNKVMSESFRLRFQNVDLLADMQQEVAAREKGEGRIRRSNAILEMLATSCPLSDVLNAINNAIEREMPASKSSILLLDEAGKHLYNASAPSLPDEYVSAINGVAIGPSVGSCGTGMYRNAEVIVEDIAHDPLWVDYRELALKHGLQACWSIPIRNTAGKVLGAFALYFTAPRKPDTQEMGLLHWAAHLAAITIERYSAAEKLNKMAHYDTLTLLPNRTMFLDRLEQGLAQARRRRDKLALLFIDLDRFKLINDTLGHEAGDRALKEVAKRLQSCIREVDTAARLGGDEFTVILTGIHNRRDAALVARKIIDALSRDIELEGQNMSIGGSIGISLFPDDGEDVDMLIANSDTAMYQAKEKGGSTLIFHSEARSDES